MTSARPSRRSLAVAAERTAALAAEYDVRTAHAPRPDQPAAVDQPRKPTP